MPKILFLTHSAYLYGANLGLLTTCTGLRDIGYEVRVLAANKGPILEELDRLGISWTYVPFSLSMSLKNDLVRRVYRQCKNEVLLFALKRYVLNWKPDLIYSNSFALDFGVRLARKCKTKHLWHLKEFGDLDYDLLPNVSLSTREKYLSQSDELVAISSAVRDYLLVGNNHKRCRVINDGVYTQAEFKKLRQGIVERNLENNTIRFCFVGALREKKGQADAIRAFAQVHKSNPNISLTIAGNGGEHYEALCHDLVSANGIESKVHFLGFTREVSSLYANSDVALVCSRSEAFGRIIPEAMAHGLPVIANAAGGPKDIILTYETGLLYDGQVEDLATSMLYFINHPDKISEMGDRAAKVSADLYSIELYIQKIIEAMNLKK